MKRKMLPLYLSDHEKNKLRVLAGAMNISMTELLRRWIEEKSLSINFEEMEQQRKIDELKLEVEKKKQETKQKEQQLQEESLRLKNIQNIGPELEAEKDQLIMSAVACVAKSYKNKGLESAKEVAKGNADHIKSRGYSISPTSLLSKAISHLEKEKEATKDQYR